MNLDDFSYEDDSRRYLKPEVSLNEQNAFIDNLRNLQQQDTAKIRQDTYNLGTAVPSNIGGLTGGSSYFTSRFQTPQTNSMVSDLRAAAQAQALSTLMSSEIAKAKKRYQDAYYASQKRANNSNGGGASDNSANRISKFNVNTDTKGLGKIDISRDTVKNGEMWIDKATGNQYFRDASGDDLYVQDLTPGEAMSLPWNVSGNRPKHGDIREHNGKSYVYISNDQYGGTWFRLGE